MTEFPPPASPGQGYSASDFNRLLELVRDLHRLGQSALSVSTDRLIQAILGGEGLALTVPESRQLGLFELTGRWSFQADDDSPSASVLPVRFRVSANAYAVDHSEPQLRVYAPGAEAPETIAGDRLLARFNAQSGRWETAFGSSKTGRCSFQTRLEDVAGWNPQAVQILGHDAAGCLHWYDISEECAQQDETPSDWMNDQERPSEDQDARDQTSSTANPPWGAIL